MLFVSLGWIDCFDTRYTRGLSCEGLKFIASQLTFFSRFILVSEKRTELFE